MKRLILLSVAIFSLNTFGQFKGSGFPEESIKEGIVSQQTGSSIFSFLNSDSFHMNHSYSLSYSSFGGQGLALGVYTNSMLFNLSNNFNIQVDASIVHSPYSSLGKNFSNSLAGIYLSRAAINYKPWDDVYISVQYQNVPNYYYPYSRGLFNSYYDPFFER